MIADIIVDLQYGDCGKGKVTHHLLKTGRYTHCIRYNGGCNAGHTIYHNGKKFVTHHIPAGVFFGAKSIIGSGCVVLPKQFFAELKELEDNGINISDVFVANNAHVILESHLSEDEEGCGIGSTKRGNGPAYRDKYFRVGQRAEDNQLLIPHLIDLYAELHCTSPEPIVLMEGAQGFGLDIDWGDYPFVTSSHCTVGGAILNGVPWKNIRNVYGVAKAYETYVGTKDFQPDGEEAFAKIQQVGKEFGATTGRVRQVNWMNFNTLVKAININGVTDIIINKIDVLREVGAWKAIVGGCVIDLENEDKFRDFIENSIPCSANVTFSESPDKI